MLLLKSVKITETVTVFYNAGLCDDFGMPTLLQLTVFDTSYSSK